MVSLKYSNPAIAERNLEQLVTSVLDAHLLHSRRVQAAKEPEWEVYATELAASSRDFYRKLVYETPEFVSYFRQATPIDLIEQIRLGSRPSRRWGASDLRDLHEGWPFFFNLINNAEHSLAKTDLYIASLYAALVRPRKLSRKIFGLIESEYHRSVRGVLDISGSSGLLAGQHVLAESIRLRNPYVDPLNFLQTHFLERWRRLRGKPGNANADALLHLLQITVGGIAFGMKSTG